VSYVIVVEVAEELDLAKGALGSIDVPEEVRDALHRDLFLSLPTSGGPALIHLFIYLALI
jgi:hypothetical protein